MKLKERLNRFLDEIEEEVKVTTPVAKQDGSLKQVEQPASFQQELKKELSSVAKESSFTNIDLSEERKNIGHVSVIDYDARVFGDVTTSESLTMNGTLIGNIVCGKHLELNGDVEGDLKVGSLTINCCNLQGNISCDTDVHVDEKSQIIGDCWNENITLSGVMKGNIYSRGRIRLYASAEVFGNVSGSNIVIDDGATIQGNIKIKRN